jgi:regulator of replication initiation timing
MLPYALAFCTIILMLNIDADPTSVLEHALQLQKKAHKAQDLEMENRQLRDRLEEYTNEFAEVKNQGKVMFADERD